MLSKRRGAKEGPKAGSEPLIPVKSLGPWSTIVIRDRLYLAPTVCHGSSVFYGEVLYSTREESFIQYHTVSSPVQGYGAIINIFICGSWTRFNPLKSLPLWLFIEHPAPSITFAGA